MLDIHTIDCASLAQHEADEDHWVDLSWTPEAERNTFSQARLHATIRDAPGVMGQACTSIGEAGGNIVGVNMRHRHSDFFDVDFDLGSEGRETPHPRRRRAARLPQRRNGGTLAGLTLPLPLGERFR